MRCQFCHNPDTWNPHGRVQYEWTAEQLLEEVLRYKSFIRRGGVTLTGGEPLMQADFVAEFFHLCRAKGIHTALDTSGIIFGNAGKGDSNSAAKGEPAEAVRRALEETDLVMLDIKTLDDTFHPTYTGHPRTNPQAFLDYLQRIGKPTWIRHVLVPGLTDGDDQLLRLAHHLAPYTVVQRVELLAYHTMGNYKYAELGLPYPLADIPDLPADRLAHARNFLREHLTCEVL